MTVLGRGDLAPPRRRRHHRRWPWVLLVLVALGVGGWFGWQWWQGHDDTDTVATRPVTCRQTTPPPPPAAARSVRLRLLNGTKRDGLAHDLSRQLSRRGFHVVDVGNAKPAPRTTIRIAPGGRADGVALAEQLGVHPLVVEAGRAKLTVLVIGHDFRALASASSAAAARKRDVAAAHPTATPCPSSTPAS